MATSDPPPLSSVGVLRNSIFAKVGGLFGLLALVYTSLLVITTSLTGQLIGVSTAIDKAGTQRMRVYKIGLLIMNLDPQSPSERARQAILEEGAQWENVLEELHSGSKSQAAPGTINPSFQRDIEALREQWEQRLRPTIELAAHSSGNELQQAQLQYVGQADSFVAAVSTFVHRLERHAADRTTLLFVLQIGFLILSAILIALAVMLLRRKLWEPLERLTQRVQSMVNGELDAPVSSTRLDEVGRLASTFEQVADYLRVNMDELKALHATGQDITCLRVGGLDSVLRRIVDRAADLVGCDLAILLVRHPMMNCWVVEAASGKTFDTLRHQILLLEETPFANQTFESKQPVVVENLALHNDTPVRFRDEFGAKSYLGVPLLGPHDSIGILGLWSTSNVRHFTDRDVRAAQQFAVYASVAIENARLFDEVESESKQLKDKLRTVELHIAELTHEVKAPAGRVAEVASWIETDCETSLDEKARRYLGWIKKEGADLASLAERTLDLARLMKNSAPIESVDTAALVQEVTRMLSGACLSKGIQVHIVSGFPRFACRRIHLRQILENLLSNAIKYMGGQAAPRIEIGCEEGDRDAVLFMHDNGMGIDRAMTEEIFKPFKRLVGDEIAGSGIGLSVVKTVVELYGGRAWVQSYLGVGSTFYVQLPTIARSNYSHEARPASIMPSHE